MPKIITLKNIKIYEVTFANYTISVVYSLIDNNNKEWDRKRTTIKNLTNSQKSKLDSVLSLIAIRLKSLENL